jgi:phosphatidylinositol alpha-1,6-mannosyltransferase
VAKKLNVVDHIRFCGIVSEEKKIALLKSSDIFVMLSENLPNGDVEGFGIALLEANSLGIPVVGAKYCGIEDAVNNYKSGILVDNKKPQELESAINEILENYDVYSKESKLWAEKFTWDTVIKKYIKLLNS